MLAQPSSYATAAMGTGPGAEPREIAMSIHRIIVAAALASTAIGAAQANGLRPSEGRSIDLGSVAGIAYYTVEHDGFRVVATLAPSDAGPPVRFEAVLASGQSVVLSTPGEAGATAESVEISRQDDQLLVHEAAATN